MVVNHGDLGARLTMAHASVATMRDTPAAAATATENSTAAALHHTSWDQHVLFVAGDGSVQSACGGWGPGCLDARMVHTTFTVSLACHMFCKWHRRQDIG